MILPAPADDSEAKTTRVGESGRICANFGTF